MSSGVARLVLAAVVAGALARAAVAQPAAARRPAPADTSRQGDSAAAPVEYMREIFRYAGGSRDPFQTLITSSDVRPTIDELRVVSIVYDARFGNSVAIVREAGAQRPHRLKRGDTIGRLRVMQIRQYEVVFQIEEFGFERQEVLTLPRPEARR